MSSHKKQDKDVRISLRTGVTHTFDRFEELDMNSDRAFIVVVDRFGMNHYFATHKVVEVSERLSPMGDLQKWIYAAPDRSYRSEFSSLSRLYTITLSEGDRRFEATSIDQMQSIGLALKEASKGITTEEQGQ